MPPPFTISSVVPRRQATRLKRHNGLNLVISNRSPWRASWNYPTFITRQVAHLIFQSVLSFQLLPALLRDKAELAIMGFIHLQNHGLIRQLVERFMTMTAFDIRLGVRIASGLSAAYGMNSSRNIVISYFSFLAERYGLPKSALQNFLLDSNRLDLDRIFLMFDRLQEQWDGLFRYTIHHECIFCHEDLTTIEPLPLRFAQLHSMRCCDFLVHVQCFRDHFRFPQDIQQCPRCLSEYRGRSREFEFEPLLYTFNRNQQRLLNNRSRNRNLLLTSQGPSRIGSVWNFQYQQSIEQDSCDVLVEME